MLTLFYQCNSEQNFHSKTAQLNYPIVVNMMIAQADTLIKLESTSDADAGVNRIDKRYRIKQV